ncbi:MAG: hypothetical protein ACTSPI_14150, partial [Candidatus Heimdallarchaeaceae archaeon]
RNINNLSSIIVETIHMTEDLKKKKSIPILDKLHEVRDGMRNLANDLSESGLQLIDQHTLRLNEIKDQIREKLDHFQLDSSTTIKTKKKQIVSKVTEKIELLPADLLDKLQSETENYAQNSYNSCQNITNNLKEVITNQIDETSEFILNTIQSCYDEHTKIMVEFQEEVSTELEKTKEDIEKIGGGFKEKLQVFNKNLGQKIEDEKEKIVSVINENKENMEKETSEMKEKVTAQIIEAEEMQIDAIVAQVAAVIKEIDDAIMEHLSVLQEKALVYYQVINTREDELKQIDKAAANIRIEGQHNVSIVVGEEAILASLTDIAMRARRELLIITPTVEERLIEEMSRFTKANRITLVSNFSSGKHHGALRNLKERFIGLKFKQYDKQDVYCAIKDGFDEAIFAFLTPDSTPVAIRTDNGLLLQIFKAAINKDVLFHTHDYDL